MPNLGWRPAVTWALLTVNGLVWLVTTVEGGSENPDVMLKFGAMFGPFIADGEYWRRGGEGSQRWVDGRDPRRHTVGPLRALDRRGGWWLRNFDAARRRCGENP